MEKFNQFGAIFGWPFTRLAPAIHYKLPASPGRLSVAIGANLKLFWLFQCFFSPIVPPKVYKNPEGVKLLNCHE
jgi:hypothetical protein